MEKTEKEIKKEKTMEDLKKLHDMLMDNRDMTPYINYKNLQKALTTGNPYDVW